MTGEVLAGKRIVLGVCGSIAAYKAVIGRQHVDPGRRAGGRGDDPRSHRAYPPAELPGDHPPPGRRRDVQHARGDRDRTRQPGPPCRRRLHRAGHRPHPGKAGARAGRRPRHHDRPGDARAAGHRAGHGRRHVRPSRRPGQRPDAARARRHHHRAGAGPDGLGTGRAGAAGRAADHCRHAADRAGERRRPGRLAGRGDGRRHPGGHRPGPLRLQSLVWQDGLRRRRGRSRPWRLGGPGDGAHGVGGSPRHRGASRGERGRHARRRDGRPPGRRPAGDGRRRR